MDYLLHQRSKKRSNATPKQYLPYPNWKPREKNAEGPTFLTKQVLSKLIKQRRIPIEIFMAMQGPR